MNFLTKTLGTLTGTSIPYSFGSVIQPSHIENCSSSSLWTIYDGKSNKDSRPVTIFEFDVKNPANSKYFSLIQNSIKKHRALALLPGVLSIVEVIESEKTIYLITEHAVPLSHVLSDYPNNLKLLGIYQLSLALKFINIEGSCIHGNPRLDNIYVTDAYEWKFGGFEFTLNYKDNSSDYLSLYSFYTTFTSTRGMVIPPEFESSGSDFFKNNGKGIKGIKFDSYILGLTLYQILTNKTPVASEILRSGAIQGLPINKLVSPSIGLRITSEQFLNNGEMSYFVSDEINAYSQFSQISLLNSSQKIEVYRALVSGNVPSQFIEIKLMPEIMNTFNIIKTNDNNIQTTLIYLLYLAYSKCRNESKSFDLYFKPVYFQSFTFADRSVRTIVLKILPKVIGEINRHEVQDKIYPNLVTGFADTDITVRTETLLSISYIMDKITDRQLNNDLLRYLAKLQADSNPQLRANTVICLSKISTKMQSTTRIGVLITAFGKALRDPDHVTRFCAVKGFETSIDFFPPDICCSKVLSALSPALLDDSCVIRQHAENAFELYMKKIRNASEKLQKTEEDDHILDDVSSLTNLLNNLSLENLGQSLLGSISKVETPAVNNFTNNSLNLQNGLTSKDKLIESELDLGDYNDDEWGFDEEDDDDEEKKTNSADSKFVNNTAGSYGNTVQSKAPVKQHIINNTKSKILPSTNANTMHHNLVLGKKKHVTKLKLNVEPTLDDDDDGWGDGW